MNRRLVKQNLLAAGSNCTWGGTFSQSDSIQLKLDFKGEDKLSKLVNEPAFAKALNGEIIEIAFSNSPGKSSETINIVYQF